MLSSILVRDIVKETTNKSIKVKILRVWQPLDQQKRPVSIEAILMDCEGNKIGAYVKRGLIANFRQKLNEGGTVKISNFLVEDNNPHKYQKARVKHSFKIHFGYVTKVVACNPDTLITSNGLDLIPFDAIQAAEPQYFIDVIGRITKRGDISIVEKVNARKMELEIEDEHNASIKVVLWEAYADKLIEMIPDAERLDNGLNMIIQFGLLSVWNGEVRISTTVHATKIFVNEDMPEFVDFNLRKRNGALGSVSRSITFLSSEQRTLKPEEWLNVANHRTPEELHSIREGGSYILFVTLSNVDVDAKWFFNSCGKCNCNVKDSALGDPCNSAKCDGSPLTSILPRFRVKFYATGMDDKVIKIVMFEDILARLIGKSAVTVWNQIEAEGDPMAFPMDFQDIIAKNYMIRVRVSREYNIERGYKDFSVEYLTDDFGLICKYIELTLGEDASKTYADVYGKGKEKVVESAPEGSTSGTDDGLTPSKRAIDVESGDYGDDMSDTNMQKSSTRPIKKEKI